MNEDSEIFDLSSTLNAASKIELASLAAICHRNLLQIELSGIWMYDFRFPNVMMWAQMKHIFSTIIM